MVQPKSYYIQKTVLYFVNECDIYEGFNLEATSDRKKKKKNLSCPVSAKSWHKFYFLQWNGS